MTEQEKITQYEQRLNRTRELVDTEAWYAAEYIIKLEDELKKTIEQLKTK
jgi:phosphopantetheine adenylyltransferase